MILPKNNNNQGVFLEMLVTAKSAIIRYPAGYGKQLREFSRHNERTRYKNYVNTGEMGYF